METREAAERSKKGESAKQHNIKMKKYDLRSFGRFVPRSPHHRSLPGSLPVSLSASPSLSQGERDKKGGREGGRKRGRTARRGQDGEGRSEREGGRGR